ncbi:MAG TPA: hypothetical protein P5205_11490 [Candidatus Paceibacterota bacterium]|nr:hypothetical protein [Verrucomicrobiota bacterium]HSA10981.1 hypothetical protein [Candidatus Paceibacterota bacterium]
MDAAQACSAEGRRAALVNLLKGNVVARVAAHLPESMHLIVIG